MRVLISFPVHRGFTDHTDEYFNCVIQSPHAGCLRAVHEGGCIHWTFMFLFPCLSLPSARLSSIINQHSVRLFRFRLIGRDGWSGCCSHRGVLATSQPNEEKGRRLLRSRVGELHGHPHHSEQGESHRAFLEFLPLEHGFMSRDTEKRGDVFEKVFYYLANMLTLLQQPLPLSAFSD